MRTPSKPNQSSPPASWRTQRGAVLPVGAEVARPVAQPRVQRRVELGGEDVDLGLGEVGQTAAVVGVEVGGDDVAHVAGGEAERLELLQRRRLGAAAWRSSA